MKILFAMLTALLIVTASFTAFSFYSYRAPSVAAETNVVIAPGTGGRAILDQLHAQGIVPAPWKIMLPVVLGGDFRSFKAGEYQFSAGLSPAHVIGSIARGEVIIHAVTVPEGFTVAQVKALLLAEEKLTGDLPPRIEEGSIAPDTVHFHRGDSRVSIVERLQKEQRRILGEAWVKRVDDLPIKTPEEALTLASIVEEETGVPSERRRVAAVYINRLRQGMALQADPTVAYGIAPGGMGRMLTRNDLKRDTPYNTYTRAGLPPGPICNPGQASIEAVLNPLQTDELFFVATGNGGHNFARTMAEHTRNIARYRAARRAE